ncbi:MFS transporter [Haloferula sp. BvORR071]|uniref:MFS transporter n=1 Tax=Haloferula sp. BvORR071 TaxID=1396141 RepID=UPI0006967EE2|nr:MFS transporter [Haloferula sp. BvORR071]
MNPSPAAESSSGNDRLSTREYAGYALGDTASNFFFQTFNIFLTYYYVDVWGIPAAVLLWMLPLIRGADAIADVGMGLLADRTQTRWGKFRPYLLWGAIPYGLCGYLMFAAPDFGEQGKVIYAYITYGLMMLSYTVINVPYSSLLGVISPSSRTRTQAATFRFIGAFAGALLISLLVRPLVRALGGDDEIQGFKFTMAIFATLSVIMFLITFASTRERVTPPPGQESHALGEIRELLRNRPWLILLLASILSTAFIALRSGSTLFYFKYVAGDDGSSLLWGLDRSTIFLTAGALGLLLGTACLSPIARRVDKKYYAAGLSMITGLCFAAFYLVPSHAFGLQIALNLIAQFCAGPTSALTWALYGDVADYGEWKFGRRSTGLVYSASLFSIKSGILVGGFLLPLFLDQFGFVRNASQSEQAMLGITLAFTLVPGAIALLKGITLLLYPLDQRRVDEIERALAARRSAAEASIQ